MPTIGPPPLPQLPSLLDYEDNRPVQACQQKNVFILKYYFVPKLQDFNKQNDLDLILLAVKQTER